MKQLIFNNIVAKDLGLIVVEGADETLSQEVYDTIKVEGRNGSLIVNKGYYEDIKKTFTLTTIEHFEEDEIPQMVQKIKDFLLNVEDNRLFYTYEDRYNIVKKVVVEDIATSLEKFGDVEVTFICEPFYYVEEYDIERREELFTYTNKGDLESYPKITIYGVGDITLTVNDTKMEIGNVSMSVIIDSKLLMCYDENGIKNKEVTGNYPTLDIGENTISIDGSFNKITIEPRTVYK